MSTLIRANLSKNSKYYISKHRYYELKHFCLQYPEWKVKYNELLQEVGPIGFDCHEFDPVGNLATCMAYYSKMMTVVKEVAYETDDEIGNYIFKAVTEDLSFTYLSTVLEIPCGRDMYYDRYRKFFWLLSRKLQLL